MYLILIKITDVFHFNLVSYHNQYINKKHQDILNLKDIFKREILIN
jgi:hypothetical protein